MHDALMNRRKINMRYFFGLSLFCLSWLNPSHFPPWVSWHSEGLFFSAVLLFAWQGMFDVVRRNTSHSIAFPVTVIPLVVLALMIWFQAVVDIVTFGGDAFVLTLYLLLCIACMVLGRISGSEPKTITQLAVTILLGSFLSAVVAFAQVFHVWEASPWINRMLQLRRPGGNLGQPNHLATLLLLGVASLMFLFEQKKIGRLPASLLTFTLLSGVAATESRTGVLSLLLLVCWWFVKHRSLHFRLSPWAVSLAGATFLGLFWIWPSLMDMVLQSNGTGTGSQVNTSVGTRWLVWPQLIEAMMQRPWWGWGFGRVATAQNAVVHVYAVSEPFTYAHNIFLDLALGIGLPLTVLLSLATSIWLWRRARASTQLLPWYCLALIIPFAVHSMLEFPFAYAYFLVPVMFAIGALEGLTGAKTVFSLGIKPAIAILFVTTVAMAWSAVEYVAIEEDFRIVRFEALRIGTTPPTYERPKVVLLTQLDALLHGGRIVPKPGMSVDELELAKNVALRFPSPATQNRYAQSLALNGNPDEAIRQLRVMRALHGENAYAQIKAGWTQLANEKYPQLQQMALP